MRELQRLAEAVVEQAKHDLTMSIRRNKHGTSDRHAKDGAYAFCLEGGDWRDARNTWAELAGTDGDTVKREAIEILARELAARSEDTTGSDGCQALSGEAA